MTEQALKALKAKAQRSYQKKQRKLGLCQKCTSPARVHAQGRWKGKRDYLCQRHRDRENERQSGALRIIDAWQEALHAS